MLKKKEGKYVTPYIKTLVPDNGIIESKSKSIYADREIYTIHYFAIRLQGVNAYKSIKMAEDIAWLMRKNYGAYFYCYPAIIPKGTPYWDNETDIAAKKLIINLKQ